MLQVLKRLLTPKPPADMDALAATMRKADTIIATYDDALRKIADLPERSRQARFIARKARTTARLRARLVR